MTKDTGHLGFLRPRDTAQTAAGSGAYSRRVGVLRWALPAVVLVILGALVIWPMASTRNLASMVASAVPNLMVENLRYSGLDDDNQPYSLTAARALQAANAKDLIDLEKPEGEVTLENGAWLAGKAEYGRYDQTNRKLWLGGDVQLFHDQGYQFTTSEAQLDITKKIAWGEQPVLIQGDFGEIRGEGFRVLDKGAVVVVTGRSHAVLNTKSNSQKP